MSRTLFIVALLGLAAVASAYHISKVRTTTPQGWTRLARADPRHVLSFRVALRQQNMDVLESMVLDRADPKSPRYSQWLSRDEMLDLVAPKKEELAQVVNWLAAAGIRDIDASGRDVVVASAPVSLLERVFSCSFYAFKHIASGKMMTRHFGTLETPEHLNGVIDFVSGLTELYEPSHLKANRHTGAGGAKGKRNDVSAGYIIPAVLRNMYSIPSNAQGSQKASICVAEFQDDASYSPSDLTWWNQQVGENAKVAKNVGPFSPTYPDGEATLDTQYAFALAPGSEAWFWTVSGWMYEFATALYNTPNPPLAVSMSWGWPEPLQCQIASCTNSKDYVTRVNNEFLKITGLGVSLFASSGDQGAPGDGNANCQTSDLSTIFPGASPWVTSVGATMLDPNGAHSSVTYNQPACSSFTCSTIKSEVACSYPGALITTGGGFSNYVPRPTWQNTAVEAHLNNPHANLPPAQYFSANNRAFPDISANGHAYLIGITEVGSSVGLEQVDGTSCSSPVAAAIFTLANAERLAAGKKPLGFLNKVLYDAPASAWQDITSGNNFATESCTNQYGYTCTAGWDPVTGLGTPNFPNLLAYIRTLP